MAHYQSAERVHNAMKALSEDTMLAAPGGAASDPDEDWSDVDEVEVRTKDHGTTTFDVVDVFLGQSNQLHLEKDGVEVLVTCTVSPRGKYDSPAKMKRRDVQLTKDNWDEAQTQVMEITPA